MVRDEVYLVPLLGRGRHAHPRKGGCLIEVVGSLGGGGPWTDRPARVDPVLATLARAVNDLSSDLARPALAPLIPWLVTPGRTGPAARAQLAVATAVAAAAVSFTDPTIAGRLAAAIGATAALTDPNGGRSAAHTRRCRRHAAELVRLAAATVTRGPADRRDASLRHLLTVAINQHRLAENLPPLAGWERPAAHCRGRVAVTGHLVAPDGGESLHVRCAAVVERWPSWLQHDWDQRRCELRSEPQPATDLVLS